jgi:uncharacterized glyoxalase superfamily metalloenzyme YdcJ
MIKSLFRKMISELVSEEMRKRDYEIKLHCATLVKSIFSEDAPTGGFEYLGWDAYYKRTAKGVLEKGVAEIVTKNMKNSERERIKEQIAGEEFIDSIVSRILKKQI